MKKKYLVGISLFIILFQVISPTLLSYAIMEEINENIEIQNTENQVLEENKDIQEECEPSIVIEDEQQFIEETEDDESEIEKISQEEKSEDIKNEEETVDKEIIESEFDKEKISEEIVEEYETEETIIEEDLDNEEENEELEVMSLNEDYGIMLMGAGDIYVGNEAEFRNALALGADVIHVRQSIDFGSTVYINYPVKIVEESNDNALRYGNGGNFIVVQNGGSLTISGMVIDTNSSGNSGMTAINIQSGGMVTFVNSSIVDGGLGNTGILVNAGATLLLWSSEIVRCGYGINLQANGNLAFATQDSRCNNFWWNSTAVFIDNFYGTANFNQNICMHDNSTYGIYVANSSGTINVSAGTYYNNTYAIHNVNGAVNVSGGNYYANGWAIWVGANLNLSGGNIYNNYYGVLTDGSNNGNFVMTGGSIYSNSSHAIQHQKGNDGGCTILGGSISGDVYLANYDNYVNTNSSYPTFTVTPSDYHFKRKLVKTSNNGYANNEKTKVTLTPNGGWYKYVETGSEYIVLWTGGNVIVRCKDYYGNILKQETKNGTIGTAYSITAPTISGYDLTYTPSNANGTYSNNDIVVEFKYDLVNVAKVNFADLLSGVISAKYWYNGSSENFSGSGTDFVDGTIFENYGFYKITVINGVGLEKTITFNLNKNSLTR